MSHKKGTTAKDKIMTQDDAPEVMPFGFDNFGFDKAIIKSIKKEGFTTPTPIQEMAILPVMSGVDLMGIAQTGSGKTAAFSLPTMNKLLHEYQPPEKNKPKVLIIAPTRELVMQIGKFIDTFSRGTPIKSLVVAGGQPYQPQIRKLKYGVDILISTPGRLIDHMGTGTVKLDRCHTFILDEADRMLDMGFIDEVKEMQAALKEDHQTVMFSATMNQKVRRLSGELLKDPEYVEQERKNLVAETVTHKLMNVRRKNKTDLLIELLQDEAIDKALVFARTKLGADNICGLLKEAFRDTPVRVDAIHGDKKQRTREKILLNFRKGRTTVLVATDVAARGIDVDGITHVINYELPIEAENYVHRVGRTGRAGASGLAISFCDPSDVRLLKEIEALIKIKIDVDDNHKYHFDLSETRDFKKGGRGKFDKPRGRKKEGGSTGKRRESGEKRRREFKKDDREFKRDEKPARHSEKPEYAKPIQRKKPSSSPKAKREYDPSRDSYKFDSDAFGDDPVMQKLRGKPVKRKAKPVEETKGKRDKKYSKKQDNVPLGKKRKPQTKRVKLTTTQKQTGGHKTFAPKRNVVRGNRSA
jgi:ATP-dependent RNA helicase RhlE